MGRIADRIKKEVADKFKMQCHETDKKQEIDEDGFGFKIKRDSNIILVYDGGTKEYSSIYPPKGQEVYYTAESGEPFTFGYDGDDAGHTNSPREYVGFNGE